jgi:hypothetical protein
MNPDEFGISSLSRREITSGVQRKSGRYLTNFSERILPPLNLEGGKLYAMKATFFIPEN